MFLQFILFLIVRKNLEFTKVYQIDETNNKCYEIKISKLFLPFVLKYNKKLRIGCCSHCQYSFFVNTTNISSPVGNLHALIFKKPDTR